MRLLLDANLSPRIAESLSAAGFDAVHVADLGLVAATDDEIFDRAAEHGLVVVTADSDFGALLAMRRATSPSVVHLRHVAELVAEEHLQLLVANLPTDRRRPRSGHHRLVESDPPCPSRPSPAMTTAPILAIPLAIHGASRAQIRHHPSDCVPHLIW